MSTKNKKKKNNFLGMIHAVQEGDKVKKAAKIMGKETEKKIAKPVAKKKKKKTAHFGDTF